MLQQGGPSLFRVVERDGPGDRLVLQELTPTGRRLIVMAGYSGPRLPEQLNRAEISRLKERAASRAWWRLVSAEGEFEFQALTIDQIDERPVLYEPLHRAFALSTADTVAARLLTWMLRMPGGARLLRRWHGSRSA